MVKSKSLVIVGNSEIAAMAYEYLTHDSEYEVKGFAIGKEFIKETTFCELPLVALEEMTERFPPAEHDAFVAIGDAKMNRVRRQHFDQCKAMGYRLATYVSTKAMVWPNVEIGENCFIFEANVLQPFVKIGDNVTLWSGNHIGHRTVIEDDCFIASHVVLSGYCKVGRSSFLGVNVAVANNVEIGADNFIGIGASIVSNTEANTMWKAPAAEKRDTPTLKMFRVKT